MHSLLCCRSLVDLYRIWRTDGSGIDTYYERGCFRIEEILVITQKLFQERHVERKIQASTTSHAQATYQDDIEHHNPYFYAICRATDFPIHMGQSCVSSPAGLFCPEM